MKKHTKLRILFLMQLYPPVHGASTAGEYIKKSRVINSRFECDYIRISTVPQKGTGNFKKIVNLFKLYLAALRTTIANKYDLVYITPCSSGFGPFYKDFGLCMISKLFGKRVIYHFHDKGISTNNNVPPVIMRIFFKNAKVILSSPLLYYDIEKYVSHENVFYCAYGITDEDIMRDFGSKSPDKITILFFAHMLRVKGVFDLLEACKILHNRNIEFVCNFVGSWYDIAETEFITFVRENNLDAKVFYLGPQYGPDKNKVLSRSDIFSLPTFYPLECFPLGILEAMRWKLPVITTSEGAISEVVDNGKTGYIVGKNDPLAIADKIQYLITHERERIIMGEAARSKFENLYTIEKFENRLIEIFQSVLFSKTG